MKERIWEEMVSAKRPSFLEGFDPFSCSERLKVPSKFVENMEGYTCGTISLAGPSGNTWHASLIRHGDGLFIHEGWESFVRDHFLEVGDSLVFRYDGNLHFTVQIFDQSSCEKEAAITAQCSQNRSKFDKLVGKKREREIAALLGNIVEYMPKKMRSSQVPYECITQYQESNGEIPNNQRCLQENVAFVSGRSESADFSNQTEYLGTPLKNFVTIAVPSGERSEGTANNRTLSAPEADKIAQAFTSSYPNFTKVMKMFNISGSYTLNIPYQFSMAHLPKCKVKIILRNVKGESWVVNSIPTTRVQTSHTFCGGWLSFVRDNNINLGDICIFELVRKCELHVQILRVRTEGVDCQNGKPACDAFINGSNYTASSQKISGRLTKKVRGNSCKSHENKITKAVISGCYGKQEIKTKNSSQDQQGSHMKSCMSMKSAPEEKIAAQSFLSNFPHFVRIMKKFNISGSFTLKIPCKFSMEHLPNCRTKIVLRNFKGECWTVNSIPTMKVQTLHTFCGGWMAFVRDNNIQMGDVCIFELVGKSEMRVHISTYGRKEQDYQSGSVASNELALMISNRPLLQGA